MTSLELIGVANQGVIMRSLRSSKIESSTVGCLFLALYPFYEVCISLEGTGEN